MKEKRFSISGGALIIIAAAYFLDFDRLLLLTVVAATVHELGHYAAMKICGVKFSSIRIELTGMVMETSGTIPYSSELIIAAAGPLASAALAFVTAYAARLAQHEMMYHLSGMSLLFCLFNILPVFPLDGGRILYSASARIFGITAAERILCVFSCIFIFTTLCAGFYVLIFTKTNFTLLTTAIWLFVGYCKKSKDGVIYM